MFRRVLSLFAVAVLATTIPSLAAEKIELNALVASNAQGAFTEIIKDFEAKNPGITVKAQWLGGSTIAKTIDEGKDPVDIAMAGMGPLDRVKNLIDPPTPILQNKEIILVPKGNPAKISGLHDLANPNVKLSLGTPGSAVGALSSQVIQKGGTEWGMDFVNSIRKNIVVEKEKGSDVLAAVGKEANATITFASDVNPAKYFAVPIEDKYNVVSTYAITIPKASKNQAAAKAFVAWVSSPKGLSVLKKFNYLPPPK